MCFYMRASIHKHLTSGIRFFIILNEEGNAHWHGHLRSRCHDTNPRSQCLISFLKSLFQQSKDVELKKQSFMPPSCSYPLSTEYHTASKNAHELLSHIDCNTCKPSPMQGPPSAEVCQQPQHNQDRAKQEIVERKKHSAA